MITNYNDQTVEGFGQRLDFIEYSHKGSVPKKMYKYGPLPNFAEPPWSKFEVPLLQFFVLIKIMQEMEHITLKMDFY